MSRRAFVLRFGTVGDDGITRTFEEAVDLLRGANGGAVARVDGISGEPQLPKRAVKARDRLLQLGEEQLARRNATRTGWRKLFRKADPSMGIELSLDDADELGLLKDFGPYSIHAEVYRPNDPIPSIVVHDSGDSMSFQATDDELREIVIRTGIPREKFGDLHDSKAV